MSKGEIVSEIGEGLYEVRILTARDKIEQRLARVEARIAELAIDVPEKKLAVINAEAEFNSIASDLDAVIPSYQADRDQFSGQVRKLQSDLITKRGEIARLSYARDLAIAENLELLKLRGQLNAALSPAEVAQVWCADFTEGLAGEVGLINVNDEGGGQILIKPGFQDQAQYAASDGALTPNIAQSAAQIFFNTAVLPGVQKFFPRYRIGVLSNVTQDSCNLTLDDAFSSAQGLAINESSSFSGVPIVYMDCNGAAFQDGDRVIVSFLQGDPIVIGFEKDPVPCSLFGFVFEPAFLETGFSSTIFRTVYGEPFEDEGVPINPPLGTPFGERSAWSAIVESGQLDVNSGRQKLYGNKNWFNSERLVLSWEGPPGRATHVKDRTTRSWQTGPRVYCNLRVVLDLQNYSELGLNHVFGASVFTDGADQRWLIVIASTQTAEKEQNFKALKAPVSEGIVVTGTPTVIGDFTAGAEDFPQSHWYFSASGGRAVCTFVDLSGVAANYNVKIGRFDIDSGFSIQQVWDTSTAIGSQTIIRTGSITNPANGNPYQADGTFSLEFSTDQYLRPIYCEYIGNSEVMVYEQIPSETSITNGTQDQVGLTFSESAPYEYWEVHESSTFTQGEPYTIITSQGKRLFQAPKRESSEWVRYYFKQDGIYSGYITENNVNELVGWRYGLLSIDARFDHCIIGVGGYTETIDVTWEAPRSETSGNSVEATGTYSQTSTNENIHVTLPGGQTKIIPAVSFPWSNESYFVDRNPITNVTVGDNLEQTVGIFPQPPSFVGHPDLLTSGAYRSGGNIAFAMAMVYRSPPDENLITDGQLSGYLEVASDLFGQAPGSDYVMSDLSLV